MVREVQLSRAALQERGREKEHESTSSPRSRNGVARRVIVLGDEGPEGAATP